MLLAAAGGLVLHMAPCTGRAEVIMAFYRNLFLPVKCSGEIEKWPLKRLVLPIEFQDGCLAPHLAGLGKTMTVQFCQFFTFVIMKMLNMALKTILYFLKLPVQKKI
jgi:hypothetical protein